MLRVAGRRCSSWLASSSTIINRNPINLSGVDSDASRSVFNPNPAYLLNHIRGAATQTVSKEKPLRQFVAGKGKSAGRNSKGRITIFHRGGGAKRSHRTIDLKRNTSSVGIVERIEYDPNRTSRIAVVRWEGEGEGEGEGKDVVDPVEKEDTFPPFVVTSYRTGMKGQFSFSSIPGMIESRKAVSNRPKTRHVVVGLSNGVSPYASKAKDEETRTTNVRDVFLSAFKASDAWADGLRCCFYTELGVPRMALAGSRPDFFVPRYKDGVQSMAPNEVKNWRKDSPVWDHRMKRKAAVSWQSVRQQDIGLNFVGVVGEKDPRMKAREKAREKQLLNGKFTADRAPVTYILATNQMKVGQMVMNIDSSKHSKDKLLKRY